MTRKKKATKKRATKKRGTKPKVSDQVIVQTFSRAVQSRNAPLAKKLAGILKKRSPFGIHSSAVPLKDLQAYEELTSRKRRR